MHSSPLTMLARSQVEGGFVQGMGWTCLEELVWGDSDHKWVRPAGSLFTRGPGAPPPPHPPPPLLLGTFILGPSWPWPHTLKRGRGPRTLRSGRGVLQWGVPTRPGNGSLPCPIRALESADVRLLLQLPAAH